MGVEEKNNTAEEGVVWNFCVVKESLAEKTFQARADIIERTNHTYVLGEV